ncbi:hypothetical protein BGW80DRAFT_130443 [Lactifluus volemus]|nr:hypothetical protein BGW80DRAFT_130443 [Lactifluus volemus]
MVQALPRHLVGWCGTYAGAELLLAGRNAGAAMKSNGTLDSTWDDRRLRRFIPHDLMCSLLAEPHHSEYMAHNQLSGEAGAEFPHIKCPTHLVLKSRCLVETRGSRMDGTDCAAAEPWGAKEGGGEEGMDQSLAPVKQLRA